MSDAVWTTSPSLEWPFETPLRALLYKDVVLYAFLTPYILVVILRGETQTPCRCSSQAHTAIKIHSPLLDWMHRQKSVAKWSGKKWLRTSFTVRGISLASIVAAKWAPRSWVVRGTLLCLSFRRSTRFCSPFYWFDDVVCIDAGCFSFIFACYGLEKKILHLLISPRKSSSSVSSSSAINVIWFYKMSACYRANVTFHLLSNKQFQTEDIEALMLFFSLKESPLSSSPIAMTFSPPRKSIQTSISLRRGKGWTIFFVDYKNEQLTDKMPKSWPRGYWTWTSSR